MNSMNNPQPNNANHLSNIDMIKVYTGFKGFAVSLLFIAGLVLFFALLFWGVTKVIELMLPVLVVLAYLLIAAFVVWVLPGSFLKQMRPSLSWYAVLMSQALSVITWMVSFLFVIKACGFLGIFLGCLLQLLVPVAIAGALVKGATATAENLAVWICFTYVMKFYSRWLMNINVPIKEKSQVIDVEIVKAE